ncbi:zinc finger protein 862-like [Mercenaria mercenaria]|uniref:zinc finger protein 862-like n=1 Tax=Mercenaria mercenaria TaxID=6596 RepID=UPI00234EF9F4|nr:zinc finger protein 862-like [Mercenaria mercenaria]
MGIKNVPKADGENIAKAITSCLTDRFGDDWKTKVVAMGTDGASVMLGQKSGVVQRIREYTDRPFIYAIHCSAHRLELAYRDGLKALQTTTPQKCDALLLNLYLFYKYSPLNRANLQAAFASLGMKMKVPTRVGGTRWLAHTKRAIDHVLFGLPAISLHLEQVRQSHRKDSAAKGKNFLKLLKDRNVTFWLYSQMDIVSALAQVSEAIQQKNISLGDVWNELESVKCILTKYKTRRFC